MKRCGGQSPWHSQGLADTCKCNSSRPARCSPCTAGTERCHVPRDQVPRGAQGGKHKAGASVVGLTPYLSTPRWAARGWVWFQLPAGLPSRPQPSRHSTQPSGSSFSVRGADFTGQGQEVTAAASTGLTRQECSASQPHGCNQHLWARARHQARAEKPGSIWALHSNQESGSTSSVPALSTARPSLQGAGMQQVRGALSRGWGGCRLQVSPCGQLRKQALKGEVP